MMRREIHIINFSVFHVSTVKMHLVFLFVLLAPSFIDENGIVQVKKELCIGCDYCVGACPYHVRYINPMTHIADKCNFCSDTRFN
ncbi:oxidoreductase, Fe-S subunit [Proteus vulgaris]|nr:oxidoreductase, Fe-S subunit [Proteus vulgaris]